jgi:hypothetical protein
LEIIAQEASFEVSFEVSIEVSIEGEDGGGV